MAAVNDIANWYQTYLGRAPEAGAVDFWTAQASSGADVANAIRSSAEAQNYSANQAVSSSYTPAPSPAPAPAPAPAAQQADVADWYRAVLGRDAEQGGLQFWQNEIARTGDVGGVYSAFQRAATENGERVNSGLSWQQANDYSGPSSVNTSTPVDDWGRNVLGRELTADELRNWQGRFDAAGGQQNAVQAAGQVYQDFLKEYGSQVKNSMDAVSASQINAGLLKPKPATGPSLINQSDLTYRTINPTTETVRGQMQGLLAEDSQYMQLARADAQRQAADRGLTNSSMAASAGTDAAIRSALGIATPDAGFYNKASDYNTALNNEILKYNADTQNQFTRDQMGYDHAASMQQGQLAQQMTIAQMQDATNRWQTAYQSNQTRYNTDANYKQQMDSQKLSLANNIILNTEWSPERKAAMLESLGMGTMAKKDASGNVIPGTGLAGSVYVIDSISADLAPAAGGNSPTNGGNN